MWGNSKIGFEQETACVHLSWLKESPEDRPSLWRAFPTLWYNEPAIFSFPNTLDCYSNTTFQNASCSLSALCPFPCAVTCCLCSQHQWWPWTTTIPALFIQFPGDGFVWGWCPVAALCSWPPRNAQSRCPWHTQSAGDLFVCQADALVMSLIILKCTCYLCSASSPCCSVRCALHTPRISRPCNVFSIFSPVDLPQQIFKEVKHSGFFSRF